MISKFHSFMFLSSSPWPIYSSLNSFNLLFSLLMFLKYKTSMSFFFSILLISFYSLIWWVGYSKEMNSKGEYSLSLEAGVKMSMILFISSEVFFFFSFFWSYFHFYSASTLEVGLIWPPVYTEAFDCFKVPLINTCILLFSGVTVTLAHCYLNFGMKKNFMMYLIATILMGVTFSILQCMEYSSSFFSMNDSTFGSSFFMLTGFHGIHVLVGTLFLLTTLLRSSKISSVKKSFLSFELASWYWHFVDVVWIFLFFVLYYLNN